MWFSRFRQDDRGNVAAIFAIAIIPVFGFVGAAVDYSRAGAMRTGMQSALDATALYLAKEAPNSTPTQLQEKANAYFQSLFNDPAAKQVVVTPTYTTGAGTYTVKVTASASIDTTIGRVLGHTKIDIGGSSEVTWGIRRLELALALDNTGSMDSNNKMTELKKAATALVETLKGASKKSDDIKISIIPFATDVNVGKSNKDANWLDWSEWDSANGKMGCPSGWLEWQDWCYKTTPSLQWEKKSWQVNRSQWNGCVTDRAKDHDVLDTAPTSAVTRFVPHEADKCPVELLPLTQNWGTLNGKIQSMKPEGNTNVTIGLAWAWHSLTSGAPLTEAAAPAQDLDKVIILLTDGDNTQNRWSNKQSEIDARTKLACENVKAAGIKIYTIRVINGNASLLKDCASSPSNYYDVQNAGQLSSIFGVIAQNLASLRIAK